MNCLVRHGLIRDDSDAQSIRLEWSAGAIDKAGGVRIVLEAA